MDDDPTPSPSEDDTPSALPTPCRRDGWTPFAQRQFLEVLAETGRVSRACEYAQMSPQSAYGLRNRDSMFAAGWDAACTLARGPLADALREQAIDGLTETIRRDGEIVAERHRHDSRLSIAVLHRLDKRCDQAEDFGAYHTPLIAKWDEWLEVVGTGQDAAARALLENAPDHQLHQLLLGENPTAETERVDDNIHYWQDEQGIWTTDFPPPADFDGVEDGRWSSRTYSRHCTEQERDLLVRLECFDQATARAAADRLRDRCIANMVAQLVRQPDLPPTPPSA